MPTIPCSTYYVYELSHPDGTPFYVGKGQGARLFNHIREAFHRCACQKCQTIRQIWDDGGEVRHTIVFETDNETLAYQYERELIATYGLVNLSNYTCGWGQPKAPKTRVRLRTATRRKSGEGTIYQRPDGRWCGMLTIGHDDGKRKRKTVYGATPKEVATKLKQFRSGARLER